MHVAALGALLLIAAVHVKRSKAQPTAGTTADWPYYGGDAGGSRYSPLTQIDRSNVAQLEGRLGVPHRGYLRRQR